MPNPWLTGASARGSQQDLTHYSAGKTRQKQEQDSTSGNRYSQLLSSPERGENRIPGSVVNPLIDSKSHVSRGDSMRPPSSLSMRGQ